MAESVVSPTLIWLDKVSQNRVSLCFTVNYYKKVLAIQRIEYYAKWIGQYHEQGYNSTNLYYREVVQSLVKPIKHKKKVLYFSLDLFFYNSAYTNNISNIVEVLFI